MKSNVVFATDERQAPRDNSTYKRLAHETLAHYLAGECNLEQAQILESVCKAPWALVAIAPLPKPGQTELRDMHRLIVNTVINCEVAIVDNLVVTFLSYADTHRLTEEVLGKGKLAKCPSAISLPFDSVEEIPQQFRLIAYCLAELKGEPSKTRDAKDGAFSFLKAEIEKKVDTKALLHPALAILAEYDAANRSNLLDTLEVYLDNDRNAQQCANKLYLHRNSLQYRVRRIQAIAGVNLDDPAERAYLRLSFMLKP